MNPIVSVSNSQSEILDIRDLLNNALAEHLGDYLTLSVRSDGNHTTVSIATADSHPQILAVVLQGIAANNFPKLFSMLRSIPHASTCSDSCRK